MEINIIKKIDVGHVSRSKKVLVVTYTEMQERKYLLVFDK